jgi:tetratricopeptide (TPR) repeat protein
MRTHIGFALKWARAAQYAPSEEVLRVLQRARKFAESLGAQALAAQAVYWTGRQYYSLGKMRDATPFFEQCIAMAEVLKEPEFLALPYNAIGRSCLLTGDTAKGIDYLERGVAITEALGDKDELAYSTAFLGLLYGRAGRFQEAYPLADKALRIAQEASNASREAMALNVLGAIHWQQGNWREGLEHSSRAQAVAQRTGDPITEGFAKGSMGYFMVMLGDRTQGLRRLHEGIEQIESTGSRILLTNYYALLSECYTIVGPVAEALRFGKQALDNANQTGAHWGVQIAHRTLALAAILQDPPDWDEAERAARESLRFSMANLLRPEVARAHACIAEVLAKKGDRERAREHLAEALRLFTELEMPWWLEQTRRLAAALAVL